MSDFYAEVKERIGTIEEIEDVIRIVDPVSHGVTVIKENDNRNSQCKCYKFWEKAIRCDNCISMRAYNKKDTFVKIECVSNKVYLLKAIPVAIEGKTYVIEAIKDISRNGRIFNNTESNLNLETFIDAMNEKNIVDKVSGLYNRNYIDEKLIVDINNCSVNGYSFVAIKITLDYLKSIGYKHGKDIENIILKEFGQIAKKLIINKLDWVGRYDIDSFICFFNNVDCTYVNIILERINNLFSDFILKYNNKGINLTISTKVYCPEEIYFSSDITYEEVYRQLSSEGDDNKVDMSVDINVDSIYKLQNKISEMQEVLNEICATSEEDIDYEKRLEISQYLDELIVKYMKSMNS